MIDKQFLVEREGRTVALYAGLLDAAHRAGLKRITTTVVQVGAPANVPPELAGALPRLAETRAKARALRDALNAGALLTLEELGGHPAGEAPPASRPIPPPVPPHAPAAAAAPPAPAEDAATPAQVSAIERLSRERAVSPAELDQAYQAAGARAGQPLSKRQASLVIRALQGHATRQAG
jgi:hypothetical protein